MAWLQQLAPDVTLKLLVLYVQTHAGSLVRLTVVFRRCYEPVLRRLSAPSAGAYGCCPLYLIRAVMALYEETRATVRTAGGFSPSFLIEQGTREGCLLSPLLFLIFFADAVEHTSKIRFADGQVLLGALVAVIILFADDVVLLARSLPFCSVFLAVNPNTVNPVNPVYTLSMPCLYLVCEP